MNELYICTYNKCAEKSLAWQKKEFWQILGSSLNKEVFDTSLYTITTLTGGKQNPMHKVFIFSYYI